MDDLLALSRAELDEAKRLLRFRFAAQLLTLALAVVALFVKAPGAYWVALAAFLVQVVAWSLRQAAGTRAGHGNEGMRRAMLSKHLGSTAERLQTADLRQRFSNGAKQRAPEFRDSSYWSTSGDPGPENLRDGAQESAFWSTHLYGAAAKRSMIFCGIVAAVALIPLFVIVFAGPGEVGLAVARISVVLLAFLVASDQLAQALQWHAAAGRAAQVDRRLEGVDLGQPDTAVAIFSDYAVATSGVPPIPDKIYKQKHDELNEAWAQRRA